MRFFDFDIVVSPFHTTEKNLRLLKVKSFAENVLQKEGKRRQVQICQTSHFQQKVDVENPRKTHGITENILKMVNISNIAKISKTVMMLMSEKLWN